MRSLREVDRHMPDEDAEDRPSSDWYPPRNVRMPGSFRNWGKGSHARAIGMSIAALILAIAISGYQADAYGLALFVAMVLVAIILFVVSFPTYVFTPTPEKSS